MTSQELDPTALAFCLAYSVIILLVVLFLAYDTILRFIERKKNK